MSEEPAEKTKPRLSPAGDRARAEQQARQAVALRENLSRRKQQQRARAAASAAEGEALARPVKPPRG